MIASNPSFKSVENLIDLSEATRQINADQQAHELGRAVWRVIDTLAATSSLPGTAAGQYNSYSSAAMAPVTIAPTVTASFEFRIPAYPLDLSSSLGKDWALACYNGINLDRYDTPEDLLNLNQDPASETDIVLRPWNYTPQPGANRNRPYRASIETPAVNHELFGPYVNPVIIVLGQLAEHYANLPGREQA